MIRATAITLALFLILGGCLFGAAGQLSWPMAWAVLGVYSVSKAACFAFADPGLMRERAAPGPGMDRRDVVARMVLAFVPPFRHCCERWMPTKTANCQLAKSKTPRLR